MAKQLLKEFATKAYRRPSDEQTVDRTSELAEQGLYNPNKKKKHTFEGGNWRSR